MAGRRANREGTAIRLPNGNWQGRIRVGATTYTKVAKTKQEALKKVGDYYRQQHLTEGTTVGHIATLWLSTPGWTETTRNTYASRWANLLEPHWANIPIANLTTPEIAEWARRYDHEPSKKIVALQTLSAVLLEAQRLGHITHNPAALVKKPRQQRRKPNPLAAEEVKAVLDATANPKYHTLFAVMLYAGLRSKEARNLQWTDIQDGIIHIRRETTKTDAGARAVPIIPALQQILDDYPKGECPYLFPNRNGGPEAASSTDYAWKRALEKAGVEPRRIHDMRHTCGSLLAAQGVPLRTIQAILGHTKADQSMHYSRQHEADLKAAVANLPSW